MYSAFTVSACSAIPWAAPYALAVTQRLEDRIPLTVIGSGSGPYSEQWFRDSANMSRTSRQYYALAIRAPRLFGAMQMASTPRSPKAIERMLSLVSRGGSPNSLYARSRPEETRIAMSAVADGARQGSRGPTDDIRRIAQPWGFELSEVKGPVEWWHGEQDTNVDPAAGRAITARLSAVTTHFVDGGHYALYEHADEAMTSLANAR